MEKIVKWNPFNNYEKRRVYCEGVHDDYEGFRILLSAKENTSSMLHLKFENALMYQNRDESYLSCHSSKEGAFDFPHAFYNIENSELVAKFHSDSSEAYAHLAIKHFAIYTCNDCIDVLSVEEPLAENLNE